MDSGPGPTGGGGNRWVAMSDSESSGDDEQRVVKSGKERALETFQLHIRQLRQFMRERDYYGIQTEFDKLAKAMVKAKQYLKAGIPRPLVKILVQLQDYNTERLKDKAQFKTLSARQGRALNKMKLTLQKHNKAYQVVMNAYRQNPDEDDEMEDDGAGPGASGGKKKDSDDSDSSDDDSDSSSSSDDSSSDDSDSDDSDSDSDDDKKKSKGKKATKAKSGGDSDDDDSVRVVCLRIGRHKDLYYKSNLDFLVSDGLAFAAKTNARSNETTVPTMSDDLCANYYCLVVSRFCLVCFSPPVSYFPQTPCLFRTMTIPMNGDLEAVTATVTRKMTQVFLN